MAVWLFCDALPLFFREFAGAWSSRWAKCLYTAFFFTVIPVLVFLTVPVVVYNHLVRLLRL
jgi:hypothetical protein